MENPESTGGTPEVLANRTEEDAAFESALADADMETLAGMLLMSIVFSEFASDAEEGGRKPIKPPSDTRQP